jgi:uncharacterized membrane protein
MAELFGEREVQLVLAMAGLAIVVALGVYLIGKVRRQMSDKSASANEHLTNFRELHFEGGLSDEEYRTIKAVLAEPVKRELKADGKPE